MKKNYSSQFYKLDEIKVQYILHEPQRQKIISIFSITYDYLQLECFILSHDLVHFQNLH